jgi:GTP-binding protein
MSAYPHARFITSANTTRQFPADEGVEVAVAGRSNAGKSTAINALTGRRNLARTSKTPGQTQLINFFELEPGTRLVDLPGYGYARVPLEMKRHWEKLVNQYLTERRSLAGLILIVDARRGPKPEDLVLLEWAKRDGVEAHVLMSKSDKLSRSQAAAQLRAARHAVGPLGTVQLFSAHAGHGLEEAARELERLVKKNPGDSGGRATGAD